MAPTALSRYPDDMLLFVTFMVVPFRFSLILVILVESC